MFRALLRPAAAFGSLAYLGNSFAFSQSQEEEMVKMMERVMHIPINEPKNEPKEIEKPKQVVLPQQGQEEEMIKLMKRVMYMPSFNESTEIDKPKPTLLYVYDPKYLEKPVLAQKIEKKLKRAKEYGYNLAKKFVESEEEVKELCRSLGISEEEYAVRMQHEANIFFIDNGAHYKIPIGTKRPDIDAWVAKCQDPLVKAENVAQFYRYARNAIFDENSYLVIGYKPTEEERKILVKYSQFKIRVSFMEIPDALAQQYSLEPGIFVCRPHSRFDGEFDLDTQRTLKFIPMETHNPTFDELDQWVQKHNSTKVYYCDAYEKIFPLFQKTYRGPLRCVYVLTSGMDPNSKKYERMVKDLAELADTYKESLVIAIIPKDEIAKKMGCIRSTKMRRMRKPEIRFSDYKKLVSTVESPEGTFPTADCSNPEVKCGDLTDTHYTGKYNFTNPDFSLQNLKEFIDASLEGKSEQYYEEESLPLTAVRKLSRVNFPQEVLNSDKDVLIELYGKYCPSCVAFKGEYNNLAKELAPQKDNLLVAKLCIDHNLIPEISDKKSYTPIFWYYKKGDKANPVQHKGRRTVEELKEFIKQNATFSLE